MTTKAPEIRKIELEQGISYLNRELEELRGTLLQTTDVSNIRFYKRRIKALTQEHGKLTKKLDALNQLRFNL